MADGRGIVPEWKLATLWLAKFRRTGKITRWF